MPTQRMTSGLQIHPRCVKCDKENSAETVLYELHNHAYICGRCYNIEIQTNHRPPQLLENMPQANIAQPAGRPTRVLNNPPSMTQQLKPSGNRKRQTTSLRLPPDSMYAVLGLSLTATVAELQTEIERKLAFWMRRPDSQEKDTWQDRLQDWQDIIDNPDRLAEYREKIKQAISESLGDRALSVGGQLVSTIEEFASACEASNEGWADGQRYLRNGILKEWVRYQINSDRAWIEAIGYYQAAAAFTDFRCLNEVLYCLVPQRPFRFYHTMQWEPLAAMPSATTPEQLAQLCDQHWLLAETHLYSGSMVYWLEHCQGVQGLQDYYQKTVIGYERADTERGVGLEMLLERAIPTLARPQIAVSFDGTPDAYTLGKWDREFIHEPITMKIENKTRGFVSLNFELLQTLRGEPEWIAFETSPSTYWTRSPSREPQVPRPIQLCMRPGDKQARVLTRSIMLGNLVFLKRGCRYSSTITMKMRGEQDAWQTLKTFPIKVKMMNGFQGMYGKLWLSGMRGNLTGLFWNFLAGALLAYIPFLLQLTVQNQALFKYPDYPNSLNVNQILQAIAVGTLQLLRGEQVLLLQYPFQVFHLQYPFRVLLLQYPFFVGIITGIAGFFVHFGKGHLSISAQQNRSSFKKWVSWLSLLTIPFFFWIGVNLNMLTASSYIAYYGWAFYGGLGVILLLTLVLTVLIAYIRFFFEQYLRQHYEAFLHPVGRRI